jgi:hypothetical protein
LKAESRNQPSQKAEIQIPKQKIESRKLPGEVTNADFTGQGKHKLNRAGLRQAATFAARRRATE